jgi:feruloyl-CoA synthase
MPTPPLRHVDLGPLHIEVARGPHRAITARSPLPLEAYDAKVTAWLDLWAARAPSRIFLAERDPMGDWQSLTYAEVRARTRALAQALLGRGLGPERPLVILSGNSIAHALLGLAAHYVGIPYAPISPSYSLASHDFGRLEAIIALLTPGLVFVEDGRPFARAIGAAVPDCVEILAGQAPPPGRRASDLAALLATPETAAVDAAHCTVGPDTIAKFMFTSGSTAAPKAVITTQRMLCANQAMIASCLRFLRDEPPVLVDWLPWSHSFGGNQNFNLALCHGGTLYIDAGRPTAEGIEPTLANLREIAPTLYFNVPRGFEALSPHLACDAALAANFFSRIQLNFFAGAPLPRRCLDALAEIAGRTTGERILTMSGYGATETSPAALFWTEAICASGGIGLPLPGTELKLVPHGAKREARIKGPHVTPGYWRRPDLCPFDEEGYYRLGDALSFAHEGRPSKGFRFDGRLGEDFKLATGAWVSVAPLRERFIEAFAPYVKDMAIAGSGEAYLAALVFPDLEACRALAADLGPRAQPAEILHHPAVLEKFGALLEAFSGSARGSSRRIARIALILEPPSIHAGELTDKGALNQSAVLANRAALVRDLYAGRMSAAPFVGMEACDRLARHAAR